MITDHEVAREVSQFVEWAIGCIAQSSYVTK